jgi:hypothetical protein
MVHKNEAEEYFVTFSDELDYLRQFNLELKHKIEATQTIYKNANNLFMFITFYHLLILVLRMSKCQNVGFKFLVFIFSFLRMSKCQNVGFKFLVFIFSFFSILRLV